MWHILNEHVCASVCWDAMALSVVSSLALGPSIIVWPYCPLRAPWHPQTIVNPADEKNIFGFSSWFKERKREREREREIEREWEIDRVTEESDWPQSVVFTHSFHSLCARVCASMWVCKCVCACVRVCASSILVLRSELKQKGANIVWKNFRHQARRRWRQLLAYFAIRLCQKGQTHPRPKVPKRPKTRFWSQSRVSQSATEWTVAYRCPKYVTEIRFGCKMSISLFEIFSLKSLTEKHHFCLFIFFL